MSKKNPAHRPKKYFVDEKKLAKLAHIGCTYDECADVLDTTSELLRKSYSHIYTKAREGMKERLRRRQIKAALAGNVVMLIWLGKQYLGQSDKQETKLSGGVKIIKDDIPAQ